MHRKLATAADKGQAGRWTGGEGLAAGYTYAQASERGETVYIGAEQFGGIWYAVNASGHNVK